MYVNIFFIAQSYGDLSLFANVFFSRQLLLFDLSLGVLSSDLWGVFIGFTLVLNLKNFLLKGGTGIL